VGGLRSAKESTKNIRGAKANGRERTPQGHLRVGFETEKQNTAFGGTCRRPEESSIGRNLEHVGDKTSKQKKMNASRPGPGPNPEGKRTPLGGGQESNGGKK